MFTEMLLINYNYRGEAGVRTMILFSEGFNSIVDYFPILILIELYGN